jgi:hypothetical protein
MLEMSIVSHPQTYFMSPVTTTPARWAFAVLVGYLALVRLVGLGLAAEFDTTSAPAGDPRQAVGHDPLRIEAPPPLVRLRDLPVFRTNPRVS